MARPKKVFWTDAEKAAVVDQAIELLRTGLYEGGPIEIFRLAMKALPESRRRHVRTMSDAPWFVDQVNATLRERLSATGRSDPAIPVIRELGSVQQRFFDEILRELREQNELLRKIAGSKK